VRKIDKLKFIETNIGSEYVAEYRYCLTLKDLMGALSYFSCSGEPVSIRTDVLSGNRQGYNLPFLYNTNAKKALELWEKYTSNLCYIVSRTILPKDTLHNVSANVITNTTLLVEYDDGGTSERHGKKKKHVYVDKYHNIQIINDNVIKTTPPSHLSKLGLDKLYDIVLLSNLPDPVWTVFNQDGEKRIVMW
jgi:hypothetical protein